MLRNASFAALYDTEYMCALTPLRLHMLITRPVPCRANSGNARCIAQKPGGWSNARYNIEMGPPLLAPLLVTMVGGMGLLAAILRRET